MEIPKTYDPKQAEERHYERWEREGCFAPEANGDAGAPVYSIVIPPPNVTGSLHMGHALQHAIMDVLTRFHRMKRLPDALAARHRPRGHLDADRRRAPVEEGGGQDAPRPRARGVHPARVGVEEAVRRRDHAADAARGRERRLVARAVHDGRAPLARRARVLRPLLRRGSHLPRPRPHQLVPERPDRALRPRSRQGVAGRQALLPAIPRQGKRPPRDRGDDAPRDDARRHGRRRQPEGRTLRRSRRPDAPAPDQSAARFPSSPTSSSTPSSARAR